MLRQSEQCRRRGRDDADASRLLWERYEAAKQRISQEAVDADDYEARVRELAREMGI